MGFLLLARMRSAAGCSYDILRQVGSQQGSGAAAETGVAETYDVITIGGGLAGAALAKRLAENGVRVLVLEREVAFRDRVRGEQMHCWGVAEARTLGLYQLLLETRNHE